MVDWCRKEAWIGVFDILGFKALIMEADREFPRALLTSKLDDLFEILESDAAKLGKLTQLVFSDTIVIFAPDLNPESYPWFLSQAEHLITRAIEVRLPLRGAISVGTSFLSSTPPIIIGPSFTDAYEYCEDQNWIGLLLTPSVTKALSEANLNPLHHDFVRDKIPLKSKCPAEDVLAYRFQNGMSSYDSHLIKPLQEMKKQAPDYAKIKYEHTINFIERHYRHILRDQIHMEEE